MILEPQTLSVIILVLVLAAAFLGLWLAWRSKRRRQAGLPSPVPVEIVHGAVRLVLDEVHYVSTTLAGQPLERLVGEPFAFRGRARLELREDGLVVTVRGTEPFAIPLAAIDGVEQATATIDRAVEPGGLTRIAWRLGAPEAVQQAVDSFFRIVDRSGQLELREQLTALRPELHNPIQEPR